MIHIWLPNPQAPLRLWQETSQTWQTAENWQELATLINIQQSKQKNKSACLYFPSLHLLKTEPTLSAQQLKQLGESGRQYLFEEISISSVEDLQIKSQSFGETTSLYALHASDRDAWINAAHLAGVEIVALLPDFLLLQHIDGVNDNQAVYYQDLDTQLLRHGVQGAAVSHLPLQLSKLPQLDTLFLASPMPTEVATIHEQLAFLPNLAVKISDLSPQPVKDPVRQPLNFAVIKRDTKIAPYLKTIAAVLLAAILAGLVVDGLRWFYYQKAEQQAKNLLKQQFEQWFPNERYNTRLTMQRQLSGKLANEQTSQSNVMTILSSIQPVLRQYQINAQSLSYQNNRLQLQLVAKDNDTLTKAVNAITAQGIAAKLGNVSQSPALTNPVNRPTSLNSVPAGDTIGSVEITL